MTKYDNMYDNICIIFYDNYDNIYIYIYVFFLVLDLAGLDPSGCLLASFLSYSPLVGRVA